MYQVKHLEDILESMENIDRLPESLEFNDITYYLDISKINGTWFVRYATEHGKGVGLVTPVGNSENFLVAVDEMACGLRNEGYEI